MAEPLSSVISSSGFTIRLPACPQVVIVGAALALVAQFLCLASATRRMRPGHVDVSTAVLFNVELALIVENLVFMLGVQSVGEPLRCQWVALALHYLHLVAAGWFLANTAFLSYRIRARQLPAYFKPVAISVWAVPAVLVAERTPTGAEAPDVLMLQPCDCTAFMSRQVALTVDAADAAPSPRKE
ncbi:hypothetical protein FOCC_FOCC008813 [Frankliniella occidentalis]|nr:hypothetical protein FOCC_FOCC008813 [Frankliniella occidentalis]